MKANKYCKAYLLPAIIIFVLSCTRSKFLEYDPQGYLSEEQLNTPEAVEKICNAAYATLAAGHWSAPYMSQWMWDDVRSDDAYKGGGGTNDQGQWNLWEGYKYGTPEVNGPDQMWFNLFECIQRTNIALKGLNQLEESTFPLKKERIAEMRFLRGLFYSRLKVLFKYFPYLDETMDNEAIRNVSNRELSDQELWERIDNDFDFASNNLPGTQSQVGRPNKFAAIAMLARTRLFRAYVQDENNQVSSINNSLLEDVVRLTSEVITSGVYELHDDIRKNFLWDFDNGIESIFAVQYSISDGTPFGNTNMERALNYNTSSRYGCCSFHQPSQNLVNAFRTDPATGLPLFDNYNDAPMIEPEDFQENTFDPRLDHTIGIPGHPFKYDPDFIYSTGWVRDPTSYGPFSPMRETQKPDCPCLTVSIGYAYNTDSKNLDVIRFDDVLLNKAEALIQLGREAEALPIINQVRERAGQSVEYLKMKNGDPISNYKIDLYKPGVNCTWTKEFAFKALQWERRLEFAMEGSRFSDLVRWGIAEQTLNKYLQKEKEYRKYLIEAEFTRGRDEYLPIPQQQINLSGGLYQQNVGYH
ncbi:MAG: RagB/SusD family nutrient uptake outer membrane protein [Chitinophagaceae bacterium]|nr:RagB/SusD family nutrient uptake outer membrane protein [Chitinophagaceae bacterium]